MNILLPSLLLVFAVIFYHCGCFLEYKLDIKDTARVVPVHGVWWVIPLILFPGCLSQTLIPKTQLQGGLGWPGVAWE